MLFSYTSIDRIFTQVNRMKPEGFNEIDIITWTGEALEFMGVTKLYEEAVTYLAVENFQTTLPAWTHNIIQIVRDLDYMKPVDPLSICDIVKREDEESSSTPTPEETCCNPNLGNCYYPAEGDGHPVLINQLGEPLTEFDLAFYRPYFSWDYVSMRNRFSPVRLTTNHFFDSLVCKFQEESEDTLYQSCDDEYKVVTGNLLRFSFQEGGIVLSYLKTRLDENGYPMIPDDVSIITAIMSYIRKQYAQDDFDSYRQGSESRLSKAESDWQWYCKQSTNNLKIPSSIDEWENLLQQRDYLIPRKQYFGFFGHLGKTEQRNYLTNTNKR